MREGGRHAVVFEAARRVHPFVLQIEVRAPQADELGHGRGVLEQGLPFADRDDLLRLGEREEFVEPPHAAEGERLEAARPFLLEPGERLGRLEPVPIVLHVEQAAALRALGEDLVAAVGRAAIGVQAALKGKIGGDVGRGDRRLPHGEISPQDRTDTAAGRWPSGPRDQCRAEASKGCFEASPASLFRSPESDKRGPPARQRRGGRPNFA